MTPKLLGWPSEANEMELDLGLGRLIPHKVFEHDLLLDSGLLWSGLE